MSSINTPNQNARIERAWKTLFNMGRAIQFESKVPKCLREYILKYATFIMNRSYSEPIKKTPFEAVHNVKPNANKLQLFGSLVYGYQHHVHKKKWDPRALPGIFIGYDSRSPAKMIYFPEEHIIRKVKDVKFTDELYYATENPIRQSSTQSINHEQSANQSTRSNLELPTEQPSENCNPSSGRGHLRRYPTRQRQQTDFLGIASDDDSDTESETCINNLLYISSMSAKSNTMTIPNSYVEAINSQERHQWLKAMQQEMDSLRLNHTFKIVPLPPGQKPIGGRWVFTIKNDPTGHLKYKARYVAKGFSQRPGINFDETYAPTVRMPTLRMLINICIQFGLILHQCDVNKAYPNSDLDTLIYMKQPEGFVKDQNLVCLLKKSIYGLKQSAMLWNETLSKFMYDQRLTQSDRDPCLYIKVNNQGRIYVLF